jgi:hypothetical protein
LSLRTKNKNCVFEQFSVCRAGSARIFVLVVERFFVVCGDQKCWVRSNGDFVKHCMVNFRIAYTVYP